MDGQRVGLIWRTGERNQSALGVLDLPEGFDQPVGLIHHRQSLSHEYGVSSAHFLGRAQCLDVLELVPLSRRERMKGLISSQRMPKLVNMKPDPDEKAIAGFWPRVASSFIDGWLIAMLTFPTTILIGYGPAWAAIGFIVITAPAAWSYTTISHGRFGKTLGKHILRIRVVRADDLGRIGYGEAIRRDAPTIILSILSAIFLIQMAAGGDTTPFRIFDGQGFGDTYQEGEEPTIGDVFAPLTETLKTYEPAYLGVIALSYVWFLTEVVTMLTNPRRRAAHDFIGGTVVVQDPQVRLSPQSPTVAATPEIATPRKPPNPGW